MLDAQLFKLMRTDKENNVRIYKVSSFRRRASIIPAVKFVADRTEALKYINRSDVNGYDPMREVILIGPTAAQPAFGAQASLPASENSAPARFGQPPAEANYASVVEDDNDSLRIEANCTQAGTLVITDGFYPDWEAYDNGKHTDILLADGVLRAIPLQPGNHHIELYFRPKSMFFGTLISLLSIALAAGLLLFGLRRKRP
jgi:hypothetical protein